MKTVSKRFIRSNFSKPLLVMVPLVLMGAIYSQAFAHHDPTQDRITITQDHLKVALEAVTISRSTRPYLEVLPQIAEQMKRRLSEDYPHLESYIITAVNGAADALTDRQSELDYLIAREWARAFSPRELREISAFFASPAGAKLAVHNTELIALGLASARSWGKEISEELHAMVLKTLEAQGKKL